MADVTKPDLEMHNDDNTFANKESLPISNEVNLEKKTTAGIRSYPEGGWGWVIVFGSFVVQVCLGGLSCMYGILNIELMATTGLDIDDISWISAINLACTSILAPFCSQLTKIIRCRRMMIAGGGIGALGIFASAYVTSPWYLYVLLGVMPGFGSSLGLMSSLVIVSQYFEKKRPFVIGLSISGAGIGMVVFPLLVSYLLQECLLTGTLFILSGFLLNWIVVGFLYFPRAPVKAHAEATLKDAKRIQGHQFFKDLVDIAVLKDSRFVCYFLVNVIMFIGYQIPLVFLPLKGIEDGHSLEASATWISILGVFSCIGRLLVGHIAQLIPSRKVLILPTCLVISAIDILILTFSTDLITVSALSAVFGLTTGCVIVIFPVIAIDTFGVEKFSSVGMLYFAQGIGYLTGTPFAGILTTKFGSTTTAFYFSAAFMLLAGIIMLPEAISNICRRNKICTNTSSILKEKTDIKVWTISSEIYVDGPEGNGDNIEAPPI